MTATRGYCSHGGGAVPTGVEPARGACAAHGPPAGPGGMEWVPVEAPAAGGPRVRGPRTL